MMAMAIHYGRFRTVGVRMGCGASGTVYSCQAPTCPACARQPAQHRIRIRRDDSPGGGFMRTLTKNDERQYRITLVLLLALLFLASLPAV